ncbi:MAG: BACON domain-containing protein [Bacteroidales bacterium]|nr:BACON domain-containing protein [Bacteroidales bacterium]
MKNSWFKCVILPVAVMISAACSEKNEEKFVSVNTEKLVFNYLASSQAFKLLTNGEWSVSLTEGGDWLSLPVTSGVGKGSEKEILVQIYALGNDGLPRSGKLALHAAEKDIEIAIEQEGSGGIAFQTPTLTAFLQTGTAIEDIYLKIPYRKALGSESFSVSVTVAGAGAAGINDIDDFPVTIGSVSGNISVPLSGTPLTTGQVIFTIRSSYAGYTGQTLTAAVMADIPHFEGAILISGIMPDPRGTDAPATGASATFANPTMGGASVHAGPYEYIQFIALENIDFSITPYAVVICNNLVGSGAQENGWATGGSKTYKFNLTQGQVTTGEFFYVGGTAKSLNGYNTCGIVDISHAKWIRTIAYNNPGVTGDGFGAQTGGVMSNFTTANRSFSGIAVFKGINVTKNTVPVDAVFFGNKTDDGYNELNDWGYLIPKNDFYQPVNPDDQSEQRMFMKGTNTRFFYGPTGTDISDYAMLGGTLNSKKQWLLPRSLTSKVMTPCQEMSYSLLDIESGPGVTQFIH